MMSIWSTQPKTAKRGDLLTDAETELIRIALATYDRYIEGDEILLRNIRTKLPGITK